MRYVLSHFQSAPYLGLGESKTLYACLAGDDTRPVISALGKGRQDESCWFKDVFYFNYMSNELSYD